MNMETELLETEVPCPSYTVNDQKVAVMTEYLAKHKRIPPLANIPLDVRTKEKPPPNCFIPSEMICPYCPGPTPPDLTIMEIKTTQATVYGFSYVQKGNYMIYHINRFPEFVGALLYPLVYAKL